MYGHQAAAYHESYSTSGLVPFSSSAAVDLGDVHALVYEKSVFVAQLPGVVNVNYKFVAVAASGAYDGCAVAIVGVEAVVAAIVSNEQPVVNRDGGVDGAVAWDAKIV